MPLSNPYADNDSPIVTNIRFQDPYFNNVTNKWNISATYGASDETGIDSSYAMIGIDRTRFSGVITNQDNGFYSVTFEIPKNSMSGDYKLDLRVFDNSLNGYWSINESSIPFINLNNPYQDITPPELVSWEVTGEFQGSTSDTLRPVMHVVGKWQDDLSGLQSGFWVRSFYPNFDPNNQKFSDTPFAIDAEGNFSGNIYLANPSINGIYSFDIVTVDNAGNIVDIAGDTVLDQYRVTSFSSLGFKGDIPIYAPDLTYYNPAIGIEIASSDTDALMFGGGGNDKLTGDDGNNFITSSEGNDTLIGGLGNDSLNGGTGNDLLYAGSGNDVVDAGAGDDLIVGGDGAGDDTYIGGVGFDTIKYTSAVADITVNLLGGTASATAGSDAAHIGIDSLSGIEGIIAGNYNDTLIGNDVNNDINGEAGNDTITGGGGNDTINGGDGSDTAVFSGTYANYTKSFNSVTNQYTLIANSGSEGTDIVSNVEFFKFSDRTVAGTSLVAPSNQTLTGTAHIDTLTGGAGNDIITGLGAVDRLDGKDGSDLYVMTLTADHTAAEITDTGTSGIDEVRFTSTTASTLTLYAGDTGIETVVIGTGNAASAVTTGTIALNVNATLVTNALTITGNAGANSLTGTAFADTLIGGAGADMVNGGKGQDNLTGGAGRDTFIFAAGDDGINTATFDKILDYAKGAVGTGDLIDYSATLTKGGNATTATASQASINQTTGIATFAPGSGTTLADALNDITARFTAATNTAGEFAFFKVLGTGDYYLFISDGTAGAGVNDDLIQLVGVTSFTAIDLTSGNLTITG